MLILGLAALGAFWYSKAGEKTPVVVVVKDVPAGNAIARSDLSTVDVAGGVTAIAGSNLDSVIGQIATVELLPNTLLQRSMVSTASPLPSTAAMVGVALKPGQLPAQGLRDGSAVEVLQLPAKDATGASDAASQSVSVLVETARVYATTADPSQSGGTLATLIVPRAAAGAVATASNAGLLALVLVSR